MTTHDPHGRALRRGTACRLALTLAAAVVVGCDAGAADDAPPDDGLATYAVSDTPTVVLEEDGTPEKLFERIVVRRTAGGELIVGDQGSSSIHVFDRDGGVVRRLARRGGGPGELHGDFALAAHGDTLFAIGLAPRSPGDVTVYSASTGYLRRHPQPTVDGRVVTVRDALAGGALLVRRGAAFAVLDAPPDPAVLRPDSITYGILNVAADSVAWLPTVVQGWGVAYPWPNGPIPTASARFPQRGAMHHAVAGDRVWLVDGESGDVRAFDASGREAVKARLPVEAVAFDAAALDRRRAQELRGAPRALDSARIRAQWGTDHRPATAPLAAAAHGAEDGSVWVRLWDADADAPQRFLVLDRDGRAVARTTVPAGLEVQHVGRDFVLGVRRDSLGVESVHEHAVQRPR